MNKHTNCNHNEFESSVKVYRLTKTEYQNATPIDFSADIRIRCKECKKTFQFIGLPYGLSTLQGLPYGLSTLQPTVSVDGEEARMPIKPSGDNI